MLESIVYRNSIGPGPLIDVGALAEGLIFYGRVAIVGNSSTLKDILRQIPPFIVLSLLRDNRIQFYYLADQTGVHTAPDQNGRSHHHLVCFSSPDHTIEKVGVQAFKDAAGRTGQARIGGSRFAKLLRPFDHAGFDQISILEALSDNALTQASAESLIQVVVPKYEHTHPLRFRVERQNEGFYIDTNIDFARLNSAYHQTVPATHSSLTEAYIVSLLQQAYEATYIAGTLESEIAISPIESVIQAAAVEAIVSRHTHSQTQIKNFVDVTLTDAYAIREAVNSGAVSFASVVKLLDSADKFRHWLREQPIEVGLLRAYYRETVKDTWAERLPVKSTRWGIFTTLGLAIDGLGAGGLGTAAGIGISAIDAFLIDKVIKGWKPHHFVEGEFKSLFNSSWEKNDQG